MTPSPETNSACTDEPEHDADARGLERVPAESPGHHGEQQRAGQGPAEPVDEGDVQGEAGDHLGQGDPVGGRVDVDVLAGLGVRRAGREARRPATATPESDQATPTAYGKTRGPTTLELSGTVIRCASTMVNTPRATTPEGHQDLRYGDACRRTGGLVGLDRHG